MGCAGSISYDMQGDIGDLNFCESSDVDYAPPNVACRDAQKQNRATVLRYRLFNPASDAITLSEAMVEMGSNEDFIIQVIGRRTSAQLKEVCASYQKIYKRSLENDFKSKLTGNFEYICVGRLFDRYEYDAYVLRHAMMRVKKKERVIIDVLCTKTNTEIHQIKSFYSTKYGSNLTEDLVDEIGGDCAKLIVSLLKATREEVPADVQLAYSDARELRRSREGAFTELCIQLFSKRSYDHLREVFEQYKKTFNADVARAIVSNLGGSFQKVIISIVLFIKDPMEHYSTILYNAIKAGQNHEEMLIRCILSRCEVDMLDIKIKFKQMYGSTLDESIRQDATKDWIKILMLLIRTPKRIKNTITSANELLDASFSSRRRFFQQQAESAREDKWARVVWTKIGATDLDHTDIKEERDNRFFAGTLRRNSNSVSNASDSHFGSYTSLFKYSRKNTPEYSREQSVSRSLTSLNPHAGNSTRKKLEIRKQVFRRTSLSTNDLEVERTSNMNSKSLNSLRKERILCRKVDIDMKFPKGKC